MHSGPPNPAIGSGQAHQTVAAVNGGQFQRPYRNLLADDATFTVAAALNFTTNSRSPSTHQSWWRRGCR